jgi:hypothetical protein
MIASDMLGQSLFAGKDIDLRNPALARCSQIRTIDTHTAGECVSDIYRHNKTADQCSCRPLRIIVSGLPPIQGKTVLEKRRTFLNLQNVSGLTLPV